MTTKEKDAKQRARPTSIAGGPGTKPGNDDRERSTERQHDPEAEQASRLRTTSYTEMEKNIAQDAEGGMAARTAHEMSLHDELARTPTSNDGGQASEKKKGKDTSASSSDQPEQEEEIEQETQHEKRRAAQQPEKGWE